MSGQTRVLRLITTDPSDAELIGRILDGDASATRALYMRYSSMANGLAFRLLGNDRDLDDVVQESFFRAFSKLSSLAEPLAFGGWLRSIVVRTTQDHIAKRRRRPWFALAGRDDPQAEMMVASSAPPDVAAHVRAVYGVLKELPPEERTVLVLSRIEQHTIPEIVALTELSESTVRRRLTSAVERLEKRMKR